MLAIKYPPVVLAAAALWLAGCPKSPPAAERTTDAAVTRNELTHQDAGPAPKDGAACVDAWIAEQGLNRFGDPPDTMYAGGTPLFDERSGTRTDRLDYILRKHPELKARCGLTPKARPDAGPATR